ncbi:MAG TPA: methionine biosynthesis protein MetW [Candidatus Goldiibacteriota bacterium]|nr:methionine biosynthesis protein MetW [Candidatus Goldiibacteriota bacterium]
MYRDIYLRNVYERIINLIEDNSHVLDLGCGNGELLDLLWEEKKVYGLGIDIGTDEVLNCIKKGVSVIQEDIDESLEKIKDESYDCVILSETLQAVKRPDYVLKQIIRIGKIAIVTFPNFASLNLRLKFFFTGKMPKSSALPFEWYNTPNIHLLTIKDFKEFCKKNEISIKKEIYFSGKGKKINVLLNLENLFADEGLFVLQKSNTINNKTVGQNNKT